MQRYVFDLSAYLLSRHCVCKQSILGLVQLRIGRL